MNFSRLSGRFSSSKSDGRGDDGGNASSSNDYEKAIDEVLALPVTLTGSVWKRREGMGKHLASLGKVAAAVKKEAWEWRTMELRGNKLVYYYSDLEKQQHEKQQKSNNWLDQAKTTIGVPASDISKPRGIMDLKEEKASIHASFGHSGAPSPFCLSVQVTNVAGAAETKLKFAFESYTEQMNWLMAMTQVAVQASVDTYNVQLLQKVSIKTVNAEKDVLFEHQPSVREPPQKDGAGDGGSGHRLWMMEQYDLPLQASDGNGDAETGFSTVQLEKAIPSSGNSSGAAPIQELEAAKAELEEMKQNFQTNSEALDQARRQIKMLQQTTTMTSSGSEKGGDEGRVLLQENEKLRQDLNAAMQKSESLANELMTKAQGHEKLQQQQHQAKASGQNHTTTITPLQTELDTMKTAHESMIQGLRAEHALAMEQQKTSLEDTMRNAVAEKEKAYTKAIVSATSGNLATVETIKKDLQSKIDALTLENKRLTERLEDEQQNTTTNTTTPAKSSTTVEGEDPGQSAGVSAEEEDDDDEGFEDCVDEFEDCQ